MPRYIDTVPTAGYRFVANETAVEQNPGVGAASLIEPAAIPPADHAGARRRRIWIPAAILLLLATAAGAYRFFDPEAYQRHVFGRIANHPISRIEGTESNELALNARNSTGVVASS